MGEDNILARSTESFRFMSILCFIGGFGNAYSYFTRGGAFVSFQTGNLTKVGISIFLQDPEMFWSCFIPIIGGVLGAVIAHIIKYLLSTKQIAYWQRLVVVLEFVAFLIIGLIESNPLADKWVNFSLSCIMMFQLSNFRKLNGSVHNTTIMTGNLRTLGQHFGEMLTEHIKASAITFLKYFIIMLIYPLGVFVGSYLSVNLGIQSIWICGVLLAYIYFILLPKRESLLQSAKQ